MMKVFKEFQREILSSGKSSVCIDVWDSVMGHPKLL